MSIEQSRTTRGLAVQVWRHGAGPLALLLRAIVEAISQHFYRVYERWLNAQALSFRVPAHIGIIMDGNRRFARMLRSDIAVGHRLGADKLREMLDWCFEHRIPVVTVWGFSLDNFSRDSDEVR